MNNSKRILEKYVYPSPFAGFVTLDCPIESGSNITQVWYRNGVDITKQVSLVSDGGNLIWRYNNTQFKRGAVAGLYQCFISNILGSDYSITRVLILGKSLYYFKFMKWNIQEIQCSELVYCNCNL